MPSPKIATARFPSPCSPGRPPFLRGPGEFALSVAALTAGPHSHEAIRSGSLGAVRAFLRYRSGARSERLDLPRDQHVFNRGRLTLTVI
jgi:hypothetical protein